MNSRKRGTVAKWFDDKGFGFIDPVEGGPQVFFHIKEVKNSYTRDLLGRRVFYYASAGRDGRPAAAEVMLATEEQVDRKYASPVRHKQSGTGGALVAWALSLGFLAAVALAATAGRLPLFVPAVYAGMSLITFLTYAGDKRRAGTGQWRTPEATLHWLELLGGWPGALVAQWQIRHKNRKSGYQFVFWIIVIMHLAAVLWLAMRTPIPRENSPGRGKFIMDFVQER